MATLPGWIKANVLITTIVAMAVALIVAISYGSSWLGVLLLSIPFVALGIAVVTAVTSFFGLAALRLIQRCPKLSDTEARLLFAGAIGLGLGLILLPCWLIQLNVSSDRHPWPYLLLEVIGICAAGWVRPTPRGQRG
jgi:hypothetical protein